MNPVTKILTTLIVGVTIASAQTLVTVNGTAITQKAVDAELIKGTQGRPDQLSKSRRAGIEKDILDRLIVKQVIYNDAKKSGVLNSKIFKTEYKKALEQMKEKLALQVWQRQLLDKVKVLKTEIKDYFVKNSAHARHILVKEEEDAKKIIEQLMPLKGEKLKAKFIELAKLKSTGPSGAEGGDLGTFLSGQMVPEFNKKVFSMKEGTITKEPVKTQFGYHVIYLEKKDPKDTKNLERLSDTIGQQIKLHKFQVALVAKVKELRKKAKIVYTNKK